jgi:hypothetical protein
MRTPEAGDHHLGAVSQFLTSHASFNNQFQLVSSAGTGRETKYCNLFCYLFIGALMPAAMLNTCKKVQTNQMEMDVLHFSIS